jgi:hypothetical protein
MSYATIYASATDADFRARCRAALWDVANRVINGESGFPASGQASAQPLDDSAYALKVLRDQATITDRILAMQVLRNSTIASNPADATDGDIQYQINAGVWGELRSIG